MIPQFSAKSYDFTPFVDARNYIDGAWLDPKQKVGELEVHNPRHGKSMAKVALSGMVCHENGKIFPEAKAEVEKGIECVEYGCALPNLAAGNQLEVSRGVACEVVYEPLGVVAGIVPFNFPCMVPLWMMPQALV